MKNDIIYKIIILHFPTKMDNEILTHDEVVEWLKIPKSTLYKLLNEKKIPAVKVGRHWRFLKADILSWLEKNNITNE